MDFWIRNLIPRTPKFIIKNILNYFIGNYLLEELNENQIEVIDNYAQCTNIDLNIKVINDNLEKQNIPLTILYGFIGRIRIYIPGSAVDGKLLLEWHDLEISIGPAARSTNPDPDTVFGTMVDSMINMQRSFPEEAMSNLIFEEKHRGKNFNALISKWISKVCLVLNNTRISVESRPISQINRCCRFLCEIEKVEFGTRDIDSLNPNLFTGILLNNNIELTGFILRWEVAKSKYDGSQGMTSVSNSTNEILYGCQLLSVKQPIKLSYTLLLNSTDSEFEINICIDTVHILLSPLPLHWMQVLASQIVMTDYDPSISKNVEMTESQFNSFFSNEEKQSSSLKTSGNESSIYYDVESNFDDNSIQCAIYDEVPLDNSDEEDQLSDFNNDAATSASVNSHVTIFDDDGKLNKNFKACISIKYLCTKVLLRNPSNDTDSWDNPDEMFGRTQDNNNWDYTSRQFFGFLKTNNKSIDSYDELLNFHLESGQIDFFSIFMSNLHGSMINKRLNDRFYLSFTLSTNNFQISETVFNNTDISSTLQIISISSLADEKAVDMKADYNSAKNEVSLEISIGQCYAGIDISIQDRLRPLLQNNIVEYGVSDRTNSYQLNKSRNSCFSTGCLAVVNISDICLEIHVPIVNLNEAIYAKSYWQNRLLHPETLKLAILKSRWLCRIPPSGSHDTKEYSPQIVIEIYAPSIIASLSTNQNQCIEIFNIVNTSIDKSTVIVKIKSKIEQYIDNNQTNYSTMDQSDDFIPYNFSKLSKKNRFKPYSTKDSSKSNSTIKVIHMPQNDDNLKQYINKSIKNSYFDLEIVASSISVVVNSKETLNILYDRLMFDLTLWEPCFDKRTNDVIVNYKPREVCDTDDEANTDTSFDDDFTLSNTKSKTKFQSKKFTCKVLSDVGWCYLQSTICEASESVIEVKGVELFIDSDIVQGLIETQAMFIVEIERFRLFHSDNKMADTDFEKLCKTEFTLNDNYMCVMDHVPPHLNDPTLTNADNKMIVLIMESQLSQSKKTNRCSYRAKQKVSTMVTANLNEICLRCNNLNVNTNGFDWLLSMCDLLSLNNPVITGYTLPDSDMTMFLHSNNCALDLCFSPLPLSSFVMLNKVELEMNLNSTESYCLSSEIGFNGSQIFIRLDESSPIQNYFKWDTMDWMSGSLADEGFVYVADFGSLDIKLTRIGSTNYADKTPTCSLEFTNSETEVHFCADSLNLAVSCLTQLMSPVSDLNSESIPVPGASSPAMNEKQKSKVNSMINDAMKEDKLSMNNKQKTEEYCDDFLLVDDIFSNVHDRVSSLDSSSPNKLSIVYDHYKTTTLEDTFCKMKRAIFKDPDGYPNVENSLVIHDFSLSFYFYAGSDFGESNEMRKKSIPPSKRNIKPITNISMKFQRFDDDNSSKVSISTDDYDAYFGKAGPKSKITRGGANRKLREAYQLKLNKINFRYALFLKADRQLYKVSRRLVFLVNNVEIMSHNDRSSVNKVMFCDCNAATWYDPKAPMVSLKMIFIPSDPDQDVLNEECEIRLSILPIRLNVDQEIVLFSEIFYKDLNSKELLTSRPLESRAQRSYSTCSLSDTSHLEKDSILIPPNTGFNKELSLGRGGGIDSISGSSPLSRASTIRMPAFDEMRSKSESNEKASSVITSRPLSVFIRHFSIYPDISIRLDYTGTRIDFTQGAIKGLFYILMQLNNVVLIIKKKQYEGGISRLENLINILMKEISEEFYAQLKSVFSKVGPISEVTEILSGIYDFFTLPYFHYQTEGGIIEGIKLGTRSITTTSLWAALTLLSKGLKIFQKMAETTYDLVSPSDFSHAEESYHSARDIREGMTNAAHGVRRRFMDSAADFQYALVRSDRALVGRIGDAIRQVPPVIASPIVATCEATNQLVDGLRYQLKPEMKIEDENKWK